MIDGAENKVGACWECGYSLRGLETPRCPECGRPFDPADEATMNMGEDVSSLRKWLMRPPGWPLHLLTASAVATSLWASASPMGRGSVNYLLYLLRVDELSYRGLGDMVQNLADPCGRFLIGLTLWVIVATMWIMRRVARGVTVRRLSRQKAAPWVYWRRWLVTPIVLASTLLLCQTSLPVTAGFWISKPWLDRAALKPSVYGQGWLGIYPPSLRGRVTVYPNQIMVVVSPSHGWGSDWGAFVYCDDAGPPALKSFRGTELGSWRVRHLYWHWYSVEYSPLEDLR